MLILAVVAALVLGGYRVYSVYQGLLDADAVEKAQESSLLEVRQYESKKEMLQEELRQLELKQTQAIIYSQSSLLMRIDPYNKAVARLTFSVNADAIALAQELPESWQIPTSVNLKSEREERIVNQYLIVAKGVSLSELMAGTEYAKIEDQYLRELVTVNRYAPSMVTIEVYGTERITAMELAEKIYAYCLSRQQEVAVIAGAHNVEVVDATSATGIDLSLLDAQLLAQSRPKDLSMQLLAKANELDELVEPAKFIPVTAATAASSGVKYAALGAVVGICIGAVVAFLVETMRVTFKSGAALSQAVSSHYLGNLYVTKRKKGLDLWAQKLLGEDVFSTVAEDDRLPLLAVKLKEAAEKKCKLLLTGMCPQSKLEKLANELQQQLGEDYHLIAAANLMINAQAIQQLKDVEGVVMVESEKTANMERVVKVKQYLDEVKINLIGVVWV